MNEIRPQIAHDTQRQAFCICDLRSVICDLRRNYERFPQ